VLTKPPLPMSGPSLNTGPSERNKITVVRGGALLVTNTVFDSCGCSDQSEALSIHILELVELDVTSQFRKIT